MPVDESVRDLSHKEGLRLFAEELIRARTPKVEPERPTPVVTERQMEQTRLEMARGKARVQQVARETASRPPLPRDPTEGSTVPVFRPSDYVPDFNHGNTKSRTLSSK